jgi:hypothetical protein
VGLPSPLLLPGGCRYAGHDPPATAASLCAAEYTAPGCCHHCCSTNHAAVVRAGLRLKYFVYPVRGAGAYSALAVNATQLVAQAMENGVFDSANAPVCSAD